MGTQVEPDPRNLIINYIPTPVTENELRALFEPFGEVESLRIICDRETNHPKGYGFVKYKAVEAAKAAAAKLSGHPIRNKRLRVTPALGPRSSQASASQATTPTPQAAPLANGGSAPWPNGSAEQVIVPFPSVAQYRWVPTINAASAHLSSRAPATAVAAPSPIAFIDGFQVNVVQTQPNIVPISPEGRHFAPTLPLAWNAEAASFHSTRLMSEAAAIHVNSLRTSSAPDAGVLATNPHHVQAVPVQQQPQPHYQAHPTLAEPLQFQPFRSLSPRSDAVIQGSLQTFTPFDLSEANFMSCGGLNTYASVHGVPDSPSTFTTSK
ncbi:putative RNA recognition motif (a k a RRM RBD or RNP domain) [Trypanosoma vivax]|uniref:Putative RNA-binding protein n=1 Tax=Trypanosoma vivax (strain Y486) TaxID=1055687 RepID=G0TYI8_TRYVY|nr:putative RNA-binding protein [Trypanosoma vivax]KAH8611784.1 putative RNA recognition motif (a k a RRM RBD or RNP domain) [Trypanosoma vivax]CCC49035.1 putative RNA-binding protein [Trypanosoma vivax Y486]